MDLSLIDHYDRLLNEVELYITRNAQENDPNALYRLRSVPGIGKILALVILYEIHDVRRFLCSAGQVRQGIGWQTHRYLRQEDRQHLLEVGFLRSSGPFPTKQSSGSALLEKAREQAR
ncbi:MAG: transposase [Truepera sp.]|nr:transposase [Truepera sp.]